jgi:hypothetical protein
LQDFILTFTLFFPYKKELRKGVWDGDNFLGSGGDTRLEV